MISMRVEPYNQDRFIKDQKQVTLYFVGVDYWAAHEGYPPPINLKGDAFPLPDIGESVTLRYPIAKDLQFKTRYQGRSVFLTKEEGGDRMAALIKKAVANGEDPRAIDLDKLRIKQDTSQLSDEEILALARARNLLPPDELVQVVTAPSENSLGDTTKTVKRPPLGSK